MNDSAPEKDEIECLKTLEESLRYEWKSTRDPETKAVIEDIAMEIRRRRDLE